MTGKDFLSLAKKMSSDEDEACRRTAISRAYYAFFHEVKKIFINFKIPLNNNYADHGKIARYLQNASDVNIVKLGHKIDELRNHRNSADYDLSRRVSGMFDKNNCTLYYLMSENACILFDDLDKKVLKKQLYQYGRTVGDIK